MQKRFISMLVLLAAVATGAWADQLASSYSSNATLNEVTVSASMEVTIATGVTVTINNGLNITSGTLTVKGPGTLVVNGKAGSNGQSNDVGGNGTPGSAAITGNIIVQDGATVQAYGGNGGNGGAGDPELGGHGANGAAAISGNVTVQGGATVKATGGNGGNGGHSDAEAGGNGGKGGNAFAGTLTYKGGTVTANGGSGGSGGTGMDGNGSSGSAGKAFTTSVNFVSSDYILTDGSNAITATQVTSKKKVVISPKVAVNSVTLAPTSATLTLGETETVTLIPTVLPGDATDKSVTWTTSNASVATVANGVVTAVAPGTATITATATNGTADTSDDKTATCTVTVSPAGYSVALKESTDDAANWQGKAGTGDYQALPLEGVAAGTAVSVKYFGTKKVESVKAVKNVPPSWKLTLSSPAKDLCIIANGGVIAQQTLDVASTEFTVEMPELTSQTVNIFATDGSGNCWYCTQENMSFAIGQTYQSSLTMTALGTESSADVYKMTGAGTIPDGKTVVLSGVNISGGSITCDGSVTMILMGANTVTATDNNAAIKIGGPGTTLTITGSGSLTAQGGLEAAGIGTDRIEDGELSFGNIVINGGTVTATGGKEGAGIGTGLADGEYASASITCGDITINGGTVTAIGGLYGAGIGTGPTMSNGGSASITCGDITINGGTVTATGGGYGPGIGTGVFQKWGSETTSNRCGNITIGAGVTSVTATKGSSYSPNSIGKGYAYGGTQNYGTITIGGTVYATGVTASPFTYPTAP